MASHLLESNRADPELVVRGAPELGSERGQCQKAGLHEVLRVGSGTTYACVQLLEDVTRDVVLPVE